MPLHLPLDAPLPRQCTEAHAAAGGDRAAGLRARACPSTPRIERGRTYRHALREAIAHEHYDRIVVAAAIGRTDGFDADDIAWLLDHAPGEIVVIRPGRRRPPLHTQACPRARER